MGAEAHAPQVVQGAASHPQGEPRADHRVERTGGLLYAAGSVLAAAFSPTARVGYEGIMTLIANGRAGNWGAFSGNLILYGARFFASWHTAGLSELAFGVASIATNMIRNRGEIIANFGIGTVAGIGLTAAGLAVSSLTGNLDIVKAWHPVTQAAVALGTRQAISELGFQFLSGISRDENTRSRLQSGRMMSSGILAATALADHSIELLHEDSSALGVLSRITSPKAGTDRVTDWLNTNAPDAFDKANQFLSSKLPVFHQPGPFDPNDARTSASPSGGSGAGGRGSSVASSANAESMFGTSPNVLTETSYVSSTGNEADTGDIVNLHTLLHATTNPNRGHWDSAGYYVYETSTLTTPQLYDLTSTSTQILNEIGNNFHSATTLHVNMVEPHGHTISISAPISESDWKTNYAGYSFYEYVMARVDSQIQETPLLSGGTLPTSTANGLVIKNPDPNATYGHKNYVDINNNGSYDPGEEVIGESINQLIDGVYQQQVIAGTMPLPDGKTHATDQINILTSSLATQFAEQITGGDLRPYLNTHYADINHTNVGDLTHISFAEELAGRLENTVFVHSSTNGGFDNLAHQNTFGENTIVLNPNTPESIAHSNAVLDSINHVLDDHASAFSIPTDQQEQIYEYARLHHLPNLVELMQVHHISTSVTIHDNAGREITLKFDPSSTAHVPTDNIIDDINRIGKGIDMDDIHREIEALGYSKHEADVMATEAYLNLNKDILTLSGGSGLIQNLSHTIQTSLPANTPSSITLLPQDSTFKDITYIDFSSISHTINSQEIGRIEIQNIPTTTAGIPTSVPDTLQINVFTNDGQTHTIFKSSAYDPDYSWRAAERLFEMSDNTRTLYNALQERTLSLIQANDPGASYVWPALGGTITIAPLTRESLALISTQLHWHTPPDNFATNPELDPSAQLPNSMTTPQAVAQPASIVVQAANSGHLAYTTFDQVQLANRVNGYLFESLTEQLGQQNSTSTATSSTVHLSFNFGPWGQVDADIKGATDINQLYHYVADEISHQYDSVNMTIDGMPVHVDPNDPTFQNLVSTVAINQALPQMSSIMMLPESDLIPNTTITSLSTRTDLSGNQYRLEVDLGAIQSTQNSSQEIAGSILLASADALPEHFTDVIIQDLPSPIYGVGPELAMNTINIVSTPPIVIPPTAIPPASVDPATNTKPVDPNSNNSPSSFSVFFRGLGSFTKSIFTGVGEGLSNQAPNAQQGISNVVSTATQNAGSIASEFASTAISTATQNVPERVSAVLPMAENISTGAGGLLDSLHDFRFHIFGSEVTPFDGIIDTLRTAIPSFFAPPERIVNEINAVITPPGYSNNTPSVSFGPTDIVMGNFIHHTIRPGDTLWELTGGNRGLVDQVIAINGIQDYRALRVGQDILIPKPNN